jgi:hypothetical protein
VNVYDLGRKSVANVQVNLTGLEASSGASGGRFRTVARRCPATTFVLRTPARNPLE